jgi:hypothetical protein
MSLDSIFRLALALLAAAAFVVGVTGWVHVVRERRPAAAGGSVDHPGVVEEN